MFSWNFPSFLGIISVFFFASFYPHKIILLIFTHNSLYVDLQATVADNNAHRVSISQTFKFLFLLWIILSSFVYILPNGSIFPYVFVCALLLWPLTFSYAMQNAIFTLSYRVECRLSTCSLLQSFFMLIAIILKKKILCFSLLNNLYAQDMKKTKKISSFVYMCKLWPRWNCDRHATTTKIVDSFEPDTWNGQHKDLMKSTNSLFICSSCSPFFMCSKQRK